MTIILKLNIGSFFLNEQTQRIPNEMFFFFALNPGWLCHFFVANLNANDSIFWLIERERSQWEFGHGGFLNGQSQHFGTWDRWTNAEVVDVDIKWI